MLRILMAILIMGSMNQVFGQLTLEHTFVTKDRDVWTSQLESELLYYHFDASLNQVYFYGSDYQLLKTVSVASIADFRVSEVLHPCRGLFNQDDKLEFIIVYRQTSGNNNLMFLYNEDGTLLQEFGNRSYAWIINAKLPSAEYKLMVTKMEYDHGLMELNCIDDIYGLAGQPTTSTALADDFNTLVVYPNPAISEVTIAYRLAKDESADLKVYDLNGRLMDTKTLDGQFNTALLNIARYPSGYYIYRCKGQSGRFIVK